MNYKVSSKKVTDLQSDCLILGVFADGQLGKAATQIDKSLNGELNHLLTLGDVTGKLGSTHSVPLFEGDDIQRLILVGCGDKAAFREKQLRKAAFSAHKAVLKTKATNVVNTISTQVR